MMMRSLIPALDLLDLAVASSEGLASESDREAAAIVAAAARRRRDYRSGAIVVAIAGGTGAGKSSLLNAIAGSAVASTSTLRPHTNAPLAWIPAGDAAISTMMSDLDIETTIEHDDAIPLAIIDLPDLDSIDDHHRSLVEAILPLVDAVVWVFDPVKYHDPSIHDEFLAQLTHYEAVFTFVLNKIDRLDEAEAEAVSAHLGGILSMDGFESPEVLAVAAAPPNGEPSGIDTLTDRLDRSLVAKRADRAKMIQDILRSGRRLATDANVWAGTPDDAHDRIRGAAGDPEQLSGVLDHLGIDGPLKTGIVSSDDDADSIDRELHRRAELAATVAALGVLCTEISHSDRRQQL